MSLIVNIYKKNFLQRFDKDGIIPYYSPADFSGLECKENSFKNTADAEVHYFIYNYEKYDDKKLILFCPGIGPGHTAYLTEIETLCRAGYRVLTLDYTGCGASGGEIMPSINRPTRDVMELLGLLIPQEEIIPAGHSLGGYTALNIVNLIKEIKKAVIISGFISIADEMQGFVKLRALANIVKRYENIIEPFFKDMDNRKYLSNTKDKILWIHSLDDPMVSYKYNAGQVLKTGNPNVKVITAENKKHNPQYAPEAVEIMNKWIGRYNLMVKKKQFATKEEQKAYFDDKPIGEMTKQDPAVYDEILKFLSE